MVQSIIVYGFMILSLMILSAMSYWRYRRNFFTGSFFNLEILLSLLIFAFFSGVRYEVGVDHLLYMQNYKYAIFYNSSFLRTEPLFEFLTLFLAKNSVDVTVYFAFLAFIQLFFIYYAFKDERYILPFLIFTLMTNGTYFMLMNGIRQTIVLCIFIYSVKYIRQRKPVKYFTWIFIGFFIHKSALLLLPLYFIFFLNKDFFKSTMLQLFLIGVALALSYLNVWNYLVSYIEQGVKLIGYNEYENVEYQLSLRNNEYNRSIRFFVPLVMSILTVLLSKKLKGYFSKSNFVIFYNLFFFGTLMWLLFFNNPLMQRPFIYFIYTSFIVSAYLLFYLWKHLNKDAFYLPIFVLIIVMHLGFLYAFIAADFYSYYKFIWDIF